MSSLERHRGIVVGIDGSPSSTAAIEWAARDAEMRNVPLTMVHVVPPVVASSRVVYESDLISGTGVS